MTDFHARVQSRGASLPPATAESPTTAPPTERVVGPLSQADAQALATMNDRLKAYLDIHNDLERGPAAATEGSDPKADRRQPA